MINFVEVDLDSLVTDTNIGIDLYIRRDSTHLLYMKGDGVFTEDRRQRLLENNHRRVYFAYEDREVYYSYLEKNLEAIIENPSIPFVKKTQFAYEATTHTVEHLFEDPRSSESIRKSKQIIRFSVDLILNKEKALKHMLQVMSTDYYTYSHSVNVTIFAVALAQRLFGEDSDIDCHALGQGFLLHDLGKTQIERKILKKKTALTEDEWKLMRRHPELGFEILENSGEITEEIKRIVLQHHERYSGGGYPKGKKGEEIHPYGRICCIADVFDALSTHRSYRDAMTTFDSLRLMRDEMNDHFDPHYFHEFIQLFEK